MPFYSTYSELRSTYWYVVCPGILRNSNNVVPVLSRIEISFCEVRHHYNMADDPSAVVQWGYIH